jgi:hypothetical protein
VTLTTKVLFAFIFWTLNKCFFCFAASDSRLKPRKEEEEPKLRVLLSFGIDGQEKGNLVSTLIAGPWHKPSRN